MKGMVPRGFGIGQIQRGRFIFHCAEAAPYLPVAEWDHDAAANFQHLKELIYNRT